MMKDYQEWLEQVDEIFKKNFGGLTHRDFEDAGWIVWFDADYSPADAFNEWADDNGKTFYVSV